MGVGEEKLQEFITIYYHLYHPSDSDLVIETIDIDLQYYGLLHKCFRLTPFQDSRVLQEQFETRKQKLGCFRSFFLDF